ncbi:MAG: MFS transporter [Acetobacteraceae bacterium]|nr:MFS transporter [Acetobacteraceae bacterium]
MPRDGRSGAGLGRAAPALFGHNGWLGFALVFCVYAYQGLVAGFGVAALPNHHVGLGASAPEVAWHVALVGLPWVLQPAWGPLVDRYGDFRMGRRRFWALLALAGSIAVLLALAVSAASGDPVADPPLGATTPFLAAHSALAALLDTALDGMVIDRMPREHLGRANAFTRAGFVTGTAAGTALFASVLPVGHGFQASVAALAVAGALAGALPALVREEAGDAWLSLQRRPAGSGQRSAPFPGLLRRLLAPMLRRQSLALVSFCLAVEATVAVVQLRTGLELIRKRGWDAEALSHWQAGFGLLSGTLGAFAVGWWSDRLGALRGLSAVLLAGAAAHAGLALLLAGGAGASAPAAAAMASALPVLIFVALAPTVMRASRGPGAATRFALFMAALNLGGVAGSAAAGEVGDGVPLWAPVLAAGCVYAACSAVAQRPGLLFRRPAGAAAAD